MTKKEFENGAVVLVYEDHSLPVVVIRSVSKGGQLAETDEHKGLFKLFSD